MKKVKPIIKRIFWGMFFLLAAAVVALQTFGVITIGLNIGTIILLIVILAFIISCLTKFFWVGVFIPAAWGAVLLSQGGILPEMTGEQIGMTFAIAGLVAIAFHILFHTHRFSGWHSSNGKGGSETNFGSAVKYFNEEPLENADIECNFGSVKAYFTDSKLKNKTAHINIECNFGTVELFVPKNWRIEQNIDNSFAATEEKNKPTLTDNSPSISLSGECNFGGITIIYT